TSSPISTSPSVIDSSPAIRLSTVDLPQPDGPTMVRNSPSATSRSSPRTTSGPPGYFFLTPRNVTFATALPLHRARGEPRNDPALERQRHRDQRQRDHRRRGRDLPPRFGVLAREQADRHGDGALVGR